MSFFLGIFLGEIGLQIWVYRWVSLPSPAGKGDREAVDEESKFPLGIGYDFSWCIKGFPYTPACKFKPALLIRHFVTPSPLGKASNEETHR